MQLFDLQSPDVYSCEGDLDAQTTDLHFLRGIVHHWCQYVREIDAMLCHQNNAITYPFLQHLQNPSVLCVQEGQIRIKSSICVYVYLLSDVIN